MSKARLNNSHNYAPLRLCVRPIAGILSTFCLTCASLTSGTAMAQDASLLLAPALPPKQAATLTLENSSFMYRPVPPEAEFSASCRSTTSSRSLVDYRSSMMSEGDAKSKRNMSFNAVLSDWLKFDGKNITPAPQDNGDPRIRGPAR